jgi:hypothetical protein
MLKKLAHYSFCTLQARSPTTSDEGRFGVPVASFG